MAYCSLKLIELVIVLIPFGSATNHVIDIFTNYPNTEKVLQDYSKIIENRQLQDSNKPPDYSSDFLTKTRQTSNNPPLLTPSPSFLTSPSTPSNKPNPILPKLLVAQASTPIELETEDKKQTRTNNRFNSPNPVDYFNSYNLQHKDTYNSYHYNPYSSSSLNSWNAYQNGDEFDPVNTDILESEYGTFETSPQDFSHYGDSSGDLQVQASINHVTNPNYAGNHLDLSQLMQVVSTKPSFLTPYSTNGNNRRNKTLLTDHMEFSMNNHQNDLLESDFGEIISTTLDRNRKRKGNVKKIPKPTTGHDLDQNKKNVNRHHIKKLTAEVANSQGGKLKVTNLIRKYLIKMRNGTRAANRKIRKQSTESDKTLNWLGDMKTEAQTAVKLDEGEQKFILGHDIGTPLESLKNKTKSIANKFLSLFTVIQFANSRCQANSAASQYEGTCYLASECAERNGIAMGMCAEGHGVCCVFRGSCGGVGSNNCTYFESPGYPNYFPEGGIVPPGTSTSSPSLTPDPRFPLVQYMAVESRQQSTTANALSCVFRVYKASSNVRQMRIDFIDLELAGPMNGVCVNEQLLITGSGVTPGVPAICGYNTGQHVLVDVTNLIGPLQLAVLANMVNRKRYKLRICQYTDGCSGLMNCLQSYTGVTGMIQSFNYDQAVTFSRSTPGYFNNLNYAICIRREPGYCSITYTNIAPNGAVYPFELRNFDDDGTLTVPPGQAGAGVINCPDDYIVVNGIRLCGDRLNDGSVTDNFSANAPITDTSGGPIIIPVRTNNVNTARGFKLFFTQNRCMTSGGAAGTPDPRT